MIVASKLDIQNHHSKAKLPKAFTLIELLVVIAIISVLATILLPALSKAQEYARAVSCLSREKAMGTAYQMYVSEEDGMVPPAALAGDRYWYCFLAPFLGIADTTTSAVYWDHVSTAENLTWTCNVLHGGGVSYLMPDNLNYNNAWMMGFRSFSDFDSPGNTICLIDGFSSVVNKGLHWWWPPSGEPSPAAAHLGETNILFLDGHAASDSGDLSSKYTIFSREANAVFWTVE